MSYYTKVTLVRPSPGILDVAEMTEVVHPVLDEMGISHDVMEDLAALFAKGKASLKVYPTHVRKMVERISASHPDEKIVIKARGEDETEDWSFAFQDGAGEAIKEVKKPKKPRISAKAQAATRSAIAAIADRTDAQDYSPQTTFAVGDAIRHPTFGNGLVTGVQPTKIVVQFAEAERTLVHGRGVPA